MSVMASLASLNYFRLPTEHTTSLHKISATPALLPIHLLPKQMLPTPKVLPY